MSYKQPGENEVRWKSKRRVTDLLTRKLRQVSIKFSKTVGKGYSSTVHKARVERVTLAAKRVVKTKPAEREAFILRNVNHPNIIRFYNYYKEEEEKAFILTLDYYPGGNLRQVLQTKKGNIGFSDLLKIASKIAVAMEYLHEKNPLGLPIIHFDLTTSNILLDSNMDVKISDFGCALVLGHEKYHNIWRANEFHLPDLKKEGTISEKVDVYSFALILWEMWYFSTTKDDESEMNFKLSKKEKEVDESWDSDIAGLIKQCWSLEPSKRPSFSQIIQNLEAKKTTIKRAAVPGRPEERASAFDYAIIGSEMSIEQFAQYVPNTTSVVNL